MSQAPLFRRVEELERRLAEVERRLAATDGTARGHALENPGSLDRPSETVASSVAALDQREAPSDRGGWTAPDLDRTSHAAEPTVGAAVQEVRAGPEGDRMAAAAGLAGPAAMAPLPGPLETGRGSGRPALSLETVIGGRGLPIAGAAALILGVGFLVTLAVRDGWFGRLPPVVKCGAGGMVGVALLAAAWIVSARVGRWAASGLNAAGLGALYVSAWAAWGLYSLVSPPVAFVMLAACAVLGLLIAARSRHVEVAVVSLVGGYIAPLLVGERDASPLVMPVYLLSLLAVGLGLSWRLGGAFSALRTLALVSTMLLGSFWALNGVPSSGVIALGFLGGVWAAFHAEMILSSRRDDMRSPRPEGATEAEELVLIQRDLAGLDPRTAVPVVSSFVLTGWAALLGVWIIDRIGPNADWSITGGLCVAAVLVSLVLAGHLRFLVDRPGTRQEKLGAALAAQAGGLVAATIALGIGGWMQLCAWAAVGGGAALAAGWLRSRPVGWYGAALLAAASFRLIGLEAMDPALTTAGIDVFGLWLTRWALLAGACAGAWTLLAVMATTRGLGRSLTTVCFGAATLSWLVAPVHRSAAAESVGMVWVLMGVAGVVWAGRRENRSAMAAGLLAMILGSVTLIGFGVSYAGRAASVALAGLCITKWTGLAIVAAAGWATAARVMAGESRVGSRAGSVGGGIAATVSLALAVVDPRANAASVCVAWLVMALVVAALHPLFRSLMPLRWAAVLLVGAVVAWLAAFVMPMNWTRHPWPLLLHPGLIIAAVLAVGMEAMARWARRFEPALAERVRAMDGARWCSVALVFVATSHEAARAARRLAADPTAQAATLTLWWAVFAAGLLGVGFWRKHAGARWAGLAVLGAAATKAVVFDMAGVALGWRVVVFMALGAIMLGIALVYARLQRPVSAAEGSG